MTYAAATYTQRDDQRIRFSALSFKAQGSNRLTPSLPFHTHYDVPTVRAAHIFLPAFVITQTTPVEQPFAQAWKRIRAFTGLEPGWKGPGSLAVPQAAIDDAEHFTLAVLTPSTIQPDFIGAANDGELMITWRGSNFFVDVGFHGTGTYSVYADIVGTEFLHDDIPVRNPLPAALLAALQHTPGEPQR